MEDPSYVQSPPAQAMDRVGYEYDRKRDTEIQVPFTVENETFPLPVEEPAPWQPGKELTVMFVTWNMAQQPARRDEIRTNCIRPVAHVIVVATEENGPYVGTNGAHKAWRSLVVADCLANKFVVVAEGSQWALHLMVLARQSDVAAYIEEVEMDCCKTGELGGLVGNKGGIGVGLSLSLRKSSIPMQHTVLNGKEDEFSPLENDAPSSAGPGNGCPKTRLTLLFIGAHLTAHQNNTMKRNEDYKRIVHDLKVGRRGTFEERFAGNFSVSDSRDATEEYDFCVFGGDLNYRIAGTKVGIEYIVKNHKRLRAVLVANDQLTAERKNGRVFHNFSEGDLHFRPTYKYAIDDVSKRTTDEYDSDKKKMRLPSFTDRVLFKRGNGWQLPFKLAVYTDCPEVRTSDHRPVVAFFALETSRFDDDGKSPVPKPSKTHSSSCCS